MAFAMMVQSDKVLENLYSVRVGLCLRCNALRVHRPAEYTEFFHVFVTAVRHLSISVSMLR